MATKMMHNHDPRHCRNRRLWLAGWLLASLAVCTSSSRLSTALVMGTGWDNGGGIMMMRGYSSRSSSSSTTTTGRTVWPFLTRGGAAATISTSRLQQAATTVTPSTIHQNSTYNAEQLTLRSDGGGTSSDSENRGPLKVLFLSSDTGGGHRASAESLANQFMIHFPGSSYELLDVWLEAGKWPYRTLVKTYQHLSAHPRQWKYFFHLTNLRLWEAMVNLDSVQRCERIIRRKLRIFQPDVVVSVHPTMNYAPAVATQKLSRELGKHVPFVTVVTDLGAAHGTWFQKHVDKLYVASERLRDVARRRRRITPDEKIVLSGLPIRNDFAVQAERMGPRTSEQGRAYRKLVKQDLELHSERPMIMLMGGGEGVGSLEEIVGSLYTSLYKKGIDATICVVCGRNEKLRQKLEHRDWCSLAERVGPRQRRRFWHILRPRRSRRIQETLDRLADADDAATPGNIDVVGLGFVTRMAEYMVAADILVTKAGPGTIAEAAAVGLPIMLTSFLPGQEAGNVDYVLENGFGDFCQDPITIAEEVSCWLQDETLMQVMSEKSEAIGHPHAAADIVLDIGATAHNWISVSGQTSSLSATGKQHGR